MLLRTKRRLKRVLLFALILLLLYTIQRLEKRTPKSTHSSSRQRSSSNDVDLDPVNLSETQSVFNPTVPRQNVIRNSPKLDDCPNYGLYSTLHHPLFIISTYNRHLTMLETVKRLLCVAGANPDRVVIISDAEFPSDYKPAAEIADMLGVKFLLQSDIEQILHPSSPSQLQPSNTRENIPNDPKADRDPPIVMKKSSSRTMRLTEQYIRIFQYGFHIQNENYVVVLEDDLSVSNDVVEYFHKASKVMDQDNTLFCVSAWNDNAYPATASSPFDFRRGSHFMALGWMTSRQIYNGYIKHAWKPKELEDWDKIWITQMNRIRNMECLFPEVSRTHHVKRRGDSAYSVDDFFQTDRLDNMNLASPPPLSSEVSLSSSVPHLLPTYNLSLSHLSIHSYKTYLLSLLHSSTRISSISDVFAFRNSVLLYYCSHCNSAYGDTNNRYWRDILENFFGLFSFGFNDGVIRGVHDGIVTLRFMTNMVMIVDGESKLGKDSQIAEKDVWMGRDSDRFRLKDGEVVVMGLKGESCSETCERLPAYSSTSSMTDSSDSDQPNVSTKKCKPQLLPLINQCQILQSLNSVTCKICKKEFSNLAPFVRDDEDADFSRHSTRSHLHSDESSIKSNQAISSKSSASPDLIKLIKKSTDDSKHIKRRVKPNKSVHTNSETECVTTPWRYLNCDTKGTGRERRVCICV